MGIDRRSFFVVVPYYNEARGMEATLRALAEQTDLEYSLVLVDNGSTDGSAALALSFARLHTDLCVYQVKEERKGTGAASDTGFRFAIAQGATHIARTDADCLPARDWVANIKRAFVADGLEFVVGKIKPREDDMRLSVLDRFVIPLLIVVAENYGKIHRRGRRFKYPYVMVAGNNLAITADLYVRSGGFPRGAIEEVFEDLALGEQVRTLTARAQVRGDVVVYNSIRRVRRYGYFNALRWYSGHRYRPTVVDIR